MKNVHCHWLLLNLLLDTYFQLQEESLAWKLMTFMQIFMNMQVVTEQFDMLRTVFFLSNSYFRFRISHKLPFTFFKLEN
jgi:hypothetical protein